MVPVFSKLKNMMFESLNVLQTLKQKFLNYFSLFCLIKDHVVYFKNWEIQEYLKKTRVAPNSTTPAVATIAVYFLLYHHEHFPIY